MRCKYCGVNQNCDSKQIEALQENWLEEREQKYATEVKLEICTESLKEAYKVILTAVTILESEYPEEQLNDYGYDKMQAWLTKNRKFLLTVGP